MPARRPALVVSLFLLALGYPSPASAGEPAAPAQPQQPAVSRADVLAGRATPEQTLELLRSALEVAGGETSSYTESSTPTSPPPIFGGSMTYPLLTTDLDGDGDDEIVVEQYAQRPKILVVDQGDVLWKDRLPRRSYLVGVLEGNLFMDSGQEFLVVIYRWKAESLVLGGASEHGVRWSLTFPANHTEVNGLVDVAVPGVREIAISQWSEQTGALSITTIDAEIGLAFSTVRATPERLLGRNLGAQGFVTEGHPDPEDEAVFVTPLPTGYYGERVNLRTGVQTAVEIGEGETPSLSQGMDFTGDGHRDGFINEYSFDPTGEDTATFGVFDATSLSVAWTGEYVNDFFFFGAAYPAGDANGDGGQDLCLNEREYNFGEDEEASSVTQTIRCLAGASGAELWKNTRTSTGSTWITALTSSDVDGDGVLDAVLIAESFDCNIDDSSCEIHSFEGSAVNGKDGSPLWTTASTEDADVVWSLMPAELDGAPGDDAIIDQSDGQDVSFSVWNGRTLEQSWSGELNTGGLESYIDSAGEADLDGDGSADTVVAATAYQETGEEECYEFPDGEQYCYPVYEYFPHIAAFEPGGELLWQLEL